MERDYSRSIFLRGPFTSWVPDIRVLFRWSTNPPGRLLFPPAPAWARYVLFRETFAFAPVFDRLFPLVRSTITARHLRPLSSVLFLPSFSSCQDKHSTLLLFFGIYISVCLLSFSPLLLCSIDFFLPVRSLRPHSPASCKNRSLPVSFPGKKISVSSYLSDKSLFPFLH